MNKQETPRQQKINNILQKEVATLLQQAIREGSINNFLVSVTKVHVTSDLSISKVYLSIFPTKDSKSYLEWCLHGFDSMIRMTALFVM